MKYKREEEEVEKELKKLEPNITKSKERIKEKIVSSLKDIGFQRYDYYREPISIDFGYKQYYDFSKIQELYNKFGGDRVKKEMKEIVKPFKEVKEENQKEELLNDLSEIDLDYNLLNGKAKFITGKHLLEIVKIYENIPKAERR